MDGKRRKIDFDSEELYVAEVMFKEGYPEKEPFVPLFGDTAKGLKASIFTSRKKAWEAALKAVGAMKKEPYRVRVTNFLRQYGENAMGADVVKELAEMS